MEKELSKKESWAIILIILVGFSYWANSASQSKQSAIQTNKVQSVPILQQSKTPSYNPVIPQSPQERVTQQSPSSFQRRSLPITTYTPNNEQPIDVYGSNTTTRIGNTSYGSDGSTYTQVGNTVYGNDGTTYNKIGSTVYGSNGTTYNQVGNTTYSSDGSTYTKVGNTIYGSDGSTSTTIGNTTYTNGGY